MGRRDLQSFSPRLRGRKRTLNMYIWRDNSVRSHGSRETGGESQGLRGIIQFPRIFQFRVRRKICFSRVGGFILWLYLSSQHKFITCFLLSFLWVFSLPFLFSNQFYLSFIPSWLSARRKRAYQRGVVATSPLLCFIFRCFTLVFKFVSFLVQHS